MDIGSFDTWFALFGLALICVLFVYLWLWSDIPHEQKYAWTAMDLSFAFLCLLYILDPRGWVDTALSIGQLASLVLFFVLIRRAEIDWKV
jgi:hypothetical protein